MTSYSLEALVGRTEVMAGLPAVLVGAGHVPLGDDLVLVPVPLELLRHLYDDEPVLDAVRDVVGPLVVGASDRGAVAYLHAELFDEEGSEGAVVWDHGRVVFECFEDPATGAGPLDRGLAVLGVDGGPDGDAFDRLGLGRHRTLGAWITDAGLRVTDAGRA